VIKYWLHSMLRRNCFYTPTALQHPELLDAAYPKPDLPSASLMVPKEAFRRIQVMK
jgi:hypothetical protein